MTSPVKPKKHLGQHFLCDENIACRIVESLPENDVITVIEIGAGTGVLTKYLIEKYKKNFYAVDIDHDSVTFLKQTYPAAAENILEADFLEYDINKVTKESFNVIGNFPYNISSQIMFKVLQYRNRVNSVVGMFQKEVAQRIAEKPGTKTYGILSVLLQAFYNIEYLFTVNENVFSPPPKVKSAVIRLTRNDRIELPCSEELFFKVVKTTFNQRRKTIRNSIKPVLSVPDSQHSSLFRKRPEQLSVDDFISLTVFVEKNLHNKGL